MTLTLGREIFSETEWSKIVESLSLSPRQDEVAKSLFLGMSDKQIARELEISIPTVRTHLSRLFLKFDVQDRGELILHFIYHFRQISEQRFGQFSQQRLVS